MKKQKKTSLELVLASRLRYMGYALFLFSIGFFCYALETPSSSNPTSLSFLPEEELSSLADLSPHDTFNFFAVSSLFAVIGLACLLTARKKIDSHKKQKKKS